MAFDKSALFKPRLAEADVEVPNVGTVRVRALSRSEVLGVQQMQGSADKVERRMLSLALVDPKLTEAEVGKWQAASTPDELEEVTNKVVEMSGMDKIAAKKAYKEFESNPDGEFRVPAG